MNILTIQNLHKVFGGLKAINHCSLTVEQNSITGLIGPNGAGKTTMFDLITGLQLPDAGHIIAKGQNITAWPAYKRASIGITRTFQNVRIFPELRVLDNIIVVLPDHPEKLHHAFLPLKKRKKKLEENALEFLHQVGIGQQAHLNAGELSYGQKKLLEIARAVATGADIILLDEPAAGINLTTMNQIRDYILKLHKAGKTFFIVEHNMPFIMNLCHKIIVMDYGQELAVGTAQEIQNNPRVIEAYLGKK